MESRDECRVWRRRVKRTGELPDQVAGNVLSLSGHCELSLSGWWIEDGSKSVDAKAGILNDGLCVPAPRMAVCGLAKRTALGIVHGNRVAASDRRHRRSVQPQTHLPLPGLPFSVLRSPTIRPPQATRLSWFQPKASYALTVAAACQLKIPHS